MRARIYARVLDLICRRNSDQMWLPNSGNNGPVAPKMWIEDPDAMSIASGVQKLTPDCNFHGRELFLGKMIAD